jgi:hypothetical protein
MVTETLELGCEELKVMPSFERIFNMLSSLFESISLSKPKPIEYFLNVLL